MRRIKFHSNRYPGKTYETRTDERLAYRIFMENVRYIYAHNEKFAAGKTSFTMRMTTSGDTERVREY